MRLTTTKKKEPELFDGLENIDENKYFIKVQEDEQTTWQCVVDKLGQLEDIEEELGIELLTLIKSLTDTIAIKNKDGSIEEMWACPRFQISIDKSDSWILYGPVEEQKYVSIKDYGKTWALTKEELL